LYSHWHTLTRTSKCEKLVRREPSPFIEVHPDDAGRLRVCDGELVQVSSRRGTIQVPVRVSDGLSPGMVFLPFHWGDLYSPANAANYLTISAIGRVAKQPELKFCAVNLEKVPGPLSFVPSESLGVSRNGQAAAYPGTGDRGQRTRDHEPA
jgi:ferredoxin-nitrate reductase